VIRWTLMRTIIHFSRLPRLKAIQAKDPTLSEAWGRLGRILCLSRLRDLPQTFFSGEPQLARARLLGQT
jgi:hypothetical protein